MTRESAFSTDTSSIKFGPCVTKEAGFHMQLHGARAPRGDSVSALPSRHVN